MAEDNSKVIEEAEEQYIVESIQQGRMSTEVLNVCVITEAVRHCLANIVQAMEKEDHMILEVSPQQIQTIYDFKKGKILKIRNEVSRIIKLNDDGIVQ